MPFEYVNFFLFSHLVIEESSLHRSYWNVGKKEKNCGREREGGGGKTCCDRILSLMLVTLFKRPDLSERGGSPLGGKGGTTDHSNEVVPTTYSLRRRLGGEGGEKGP